MWQEIWSGMPEYIFCDEYDDDDDENDSNYDENDNNYDDNDDD